MVVAQQDPLFVQLLLQHLIFDPQVLDRLLLLLADPARENDEQELPWMQNEEHGYTVGRGGLSKSPASPCCGCQSMNSIAATAVTTSDSSGYSVEAKYGGSILWLRFVTTRSHNSICRRCLALG